MQQLKTYLLSILFIIPWFSHAQLRVKDIPPHFDKYKLYPDSTIKTIYQTKNEWTHGWAIEFDENGGAKGIVKYKKNAKSGEWRYSNYVIIVYKKSFEKVYTPPYCGIADMSRSIKFDELLAKHLKYKK